MPKCLLIVVVLFAFVPTLAPAEPADPAWRLWEPVLDEVYLQEAGRLLPTDVPVEAVAVFEGNAFAATAQGIMRLEEDRLVSMPGPVGIHKLKTVSGLMQQYFGEGPSLFAAGDSGLWRLEGGQWRQYVETPVTDFCVYKHRIALVSDKSLLFLEGEKVSPLAEADSTLRGAQAYAGTVYVHDGKRVGLLDRGRIVWDDIADWGQVEPGCSIRDMLSMGSCLYLATDEGLGLLRGMTWYWIKGEDGLCYEDTTTLATGFDHDLWIGTLRGAIRNVNNEYQYFGHARWIPHDKVNSIAADTDSVYIATNGGIGIITYEPYTLAKKAAYYERWLEEWGQKRLGFIHSLNLINGEWLREVSDNDVGFSSHYLSAKCYQYAVTRDPAVRAEAVDMMNSVIWSEEITPIDGFPARSIYATGEPTLKAMHGSGGLPAEWHATPDGLWEWKGDTSSDEIDAHVYVCNNFIRIVEGTDTQRLKEEGKFPQNLKCDDPLPAEFQEGKRVREHLNRVIGHIVENGFLLRDVDGKPTRWGRWDPEYLQTPYGQYARGLNGMEAFNYVTTASSLTGNDKFNVAKRELLKQNYLPDILRQKLTFHPGFFTHFDDRLAFYSYNSLVYNEEDPALEAIWRRSLERSWEVKRIEGLPWFNFIYGALTGNDCENPRAVQHLREWPLDLRKISYTNSHRDDLHTPPGYRTYSERTKPLSMRETEPDRWDGNFMRLDNSNGGAVVAEPGGWLDAYWMGRYYGFISAPQTEDPELTTVPERGLQLGAKPYVGPPRPKLKHEE